MILYDFKRVLIYMNRLGVFKGLLIFFKVKLHQTKNIKVNSLKHPLSMRSQTSDILTFEQVIIGAEYDLKLPINPKVIIDAGANVGFATVFFKNKYPLAKIYSIEPDPENFELLKENTALYPDITLIKKGLWNRITHTRISDKHNLGKWAMVIEEVGQQAVGTIETITIDKILQDYFIDTIDLLKIDIETAEQYLFKDNYHNWLSKTKIIVIELHDWMDKGTAQPFFMAITKTFNTFSYYQLGENIIVVNEDLQSN